MGNTPKRLETRRGGYDWKHMQPRAHAPVGDPHASSGLCDHVCHACGHYVCSCKVETVQPTAGLVLATQVLGGKDFVVRCELVNDMLEADLITADTARQLLELPNP